jgi:acetoin utilization deacetylase AcuC-like enzyme
MKVFYRHEMVAETDSVSPSAFKPALVVADWLADGLIDAETCGFEPATFSQLCTAHDPDFVRGVLDCRYENGFYNTDKAVADSLPFTSGSMIAAATYAVNNREVVCSPSSGYHHAHYASAGSFCSFNGLLIAAMVLKQKGLVNRVSIIDCDRHYADGSQQIINHFRLAWVDHHTQGRFFSSRADFAGGRFTKWLNRAIDRSMQSDLLVVQLGADPHLLDPLGGLQSTQELAQRDRLIFEKLGHKPILWCLGGGYQLVEGSTPAARLEPVLRLHRQSARICTEVIAGATCAY